MSRRLSVLLFTTLLALTPACRMQGSSRTALMVGGAALAAGGLAVASQGPVDSDRDGTNDVIINDNLGAYMLGTVLVLGGLALFVGGATAQSSEETAEPVRVDPPATGRIIATSPVMFPGLTVNGGVVTSPVTPLTVDLGGWSIGQPYIMGGRTHLSAVADSTQLEIVLQRVARPVSADDVVARLDLSSYGPLARRDATVGAVPAVELSGAGHTVPVVVTVAVTDGHLLSIVCRGVTTTCRDAVARSTWSSDGAY